jgi:hypothetical protein
MAEIEELEELADYLAKWPDLDPVLLHRETVEKLIAAARESAKLAERVKELEGAQSESGSLECDHCGGDAIYSATGEFTDGEGGQCASCGFPGHVSIDDRDEENVCGYWLSSDDPDDRCNLRDCEDCLHDDERELAAQKARAEAAEARVRELEAEIARLHALRNVKFT